MNRGKYNIGKKAKVKGIPEIKPLNASDIPSTLLTARLRANMTQLDVSMEYGVSERVIRRWEKGESCIKAVDFMALMSIYSVNVYAGI